MKNNMHLIKFALEYIKKEAIYSSVKRCTRGFYVLYNRKNKKIYNVVYVGMSNGHLHDRLNDHKKTKINWTHFSYFEVWDNIEDKVIDEIEGLFRQIYGKDENANLENIQTQYKPLEKVIEESDKIKKDEVEKSIKKANEKKRSKITLHNSNKK